MPKSDDDLLHWMHDVPFFPQLRESGAALREFRDHWLEYRVLWMATPTRPQNADSQGFQGTHVFEEPAITVIQEHTASYIAVLAAVVQEETRAHFVEVRNLQSIV